jgi:hypothetical protein
MDLTSVDTYSEKRPQAFQRKMAAGVGGLKLAFVLFGIFIRLAPTVQNDLFHFPSFILFKYRVESTQNSLKVHVANDGAKIERLHNKNQVTVLNGRLHKFSATTEKNV